MGTAQRYEEFAVREAHGHSPAYEAWARGLAADPGALALIDALPPAKRQPNLVLAAARWHGADDVAEGRFPVWLREHWDAIRATVLRRRTQTNEVARAATLLPALAAFPGPLALIEVGSSAGLCLCPDRFAYRYDTGPRLDPGDGPSPVLLDCATSGPVPVPDRLPRVVHRAGVDLEPLDATDPDDRRWLETLVWPGQRDRLDRMRAALTIAAREPVRAVTGDLNDHVADLVRAAPAEATVVVFHSAVLCYPEPAERERFRRIVTGLPCHWISNEAPGVFPAQVEKLPGGFEIPSGRFLLAVDDEPVAFAAPHGRTLDWLATSG